MTLLAPSRTECAADSGVFRLLFLPMFDDVVPVRALGDDVVDVALGARIVWRRCRRIRHGWGGLDKEVWLMDSCCCTIPT